MENDKMKQATFLNYTSGSFTNWKEKTGADYGFIAVDVDENKLVKAWDWEVADLAQAEKDLNELGYTLGLGD
jgi:hypothetical protein